MGVVIVLSLVAIPAWVLIGALRDPTLHRRPRFWLRFAALVTCMVVPWMVGVVVAVGEQAAFMLLMLGLAWALVLVTLAPLVLFWGPGSDPGPSDDTGGGPGPGPDDDRPAPYRPIGGIPLPDGDQPAKRRRGPHRPRHPARPRRVAPERERRPSRLSPLA
jgi:hypothetical protein